MNYEPLYTFAEKHRVPYNELCTALRAALAAPQPEPLGYVSITGHGTYFRITITPELAALEQGGRKMWTPVVAAPPAAPAPAVPEVMAGPMPPMSEADEKRLNAALTIVFDLACGPADPTMMQDELVAAAESIGMRFPAPAVPDDATILAEHLTRALKANGDLSASLSKARGMVLELDSVLRMAESHNDGKTTAASIRAACEPYLPLSAAPAVPLTDTRKLCTCDGAGRGPGRACVVQAGGRLGELWKCAKSAAPAVPLTDDMVEVEFVSRGDDKGQGLHPYWKDAFREGFNFARSRLSAAPAVREPLTQAATDVLAERKRQVEAEG